MSRRKSVRLRMEDSRRDTESEKGRDKEKEKLSFDLEQLNKPNEINDINAKYESNLTITLSLYSHHVVSTGQTSSLPTKAFINSHHMLHTKGSCRTERKTHTNIY